MASACPVLMNNFQFLQPNDMDRTLGEVKATTCLLDLCPYKSFQKGVDNAPFQQCTIPACLKEAVAGPLLNKPSLDPTVLDKYQPVSNITFLGKMLEQILAFLLQGFLDETDYLDSFQSGFRPCYGMETALVTLGDELK